MLVRLQQHYVTTVSSPILLLNPQYTVDAKAPLLRVSNICNWGLWSVILWNYNLRRARPENLYPQTISQQQFPDTYRPGNNARLSMPSWYFTTSKTPTIRHNTFFRELSAQTTGIQPRSVAYRKVDTIVTFCTVLMQWISLTLEMCAVVPASLTIASSSAIGKLISHVSMLAHQ